MSVARMTTKELKKHLAKKRTQELVALELPRKKHKYGAKPVRAQGKYFRSTAEYRRWIELQILERAGEITDLEFQPSFKLTDAKISYQADSGYLENGKRIIEDHKGTRPPRFKVIVQLWKHYGPHPLRITVRKGNSYGVVQEEIIPATNGINEERPL
jgi:Protein of unknown function (DUF1064)